VLFMSQFTASYTVTGMTCDHCATSVREELSMIAGVRQVDVDVPSGRVTVTSDSDLSTDHVRSAVEEAGYHLVTG
jgi:copper chaperone CopZ